MAHIQPATIQVNSLSFLLSFLFVGMFVNSNIHAQGVRGKESVQWAGVRSKSEAQEPGCCLGFKTLADCRFSFPPKEVCVGGKSLLENVRVFDQKGEKATTW